MLFFFNDTATTEIYTLSLHDALPIYRAQTCRPARRLRADCCRRSRACARLRAARRSEEHTSELQSRGHLVCRLLLEKKKRQGSSGGAPSRARDAVTSLTTRARCTHVA